MSFTANFWTFSKKPNSTKIPTSTGDTLTCHANADVDVLRPTFYVKASLASTSLTAYNYVQIPSFSRYYWIDGWSVENGLWVCTCHVDPLASWRSNIQSQSLYVARSASDYNGLLDDGAYRQTGTYHFSRHTQPSPWRDGLSSRANGTFVVGVVGEASPTYYAMTSTQFNTFVAGLFDPAYAATVLTQQQIQSYPEAAIAINPLQYISSVFYLPFSVTSIVQTTDIPVGNGYVAGSTGYVFPDADRLYQAITKTWTIDAHPQSLTRGEYLNRSPYTDYRIFFPPWGYVPLDGMLLAQCSSVKAVVTVDINTGEGILEVFGVNTGVDVPITHLTGQIGVEFPLGQIMARGFSPGTDFSLGSKWILSKVVPAAASTTPQQLYSGIMGMLGYVDAWQRDQYEQNIPQVSTSGGYGGFASLAGDTVDLLQIFHDVEDEDRPQFGKPLNEIRTLSTLSGYTQCRDADISIPAYAAEISEIQRALLGGLFLE